MWTTEHTATSDSEPAAIWAALRDLHSGIPLGEHSDQFELHGPFAVGTEVSVTPQGQATMRSVITELDEGRRYADTTHYGELTLLFRHTLSPLDDGGTRVTHRLEIDGPGADEAGPELGPQISADFPVAMDELITAAQIRSRGHAGTLR
ncbi:MAG: SRPBCC family protein [Nocardioidaceae bacterium]